MPTARQLEILRLFRDPPYWRTPTKLVRYKGTGVSPSAAAAACKALHRDGYLQNSGPAYSLTEKGIAAKKEPQ